MNIKSLMAGACLILVTALIAVYPGWASYIENPPGIVFAFAGANCPAHSHLADGSSLLRAGTYAGLFSAIGTTYGSADGSHFTLPDYRGLFLRGVGTNGAGYTLMNGGSPAGAALGTYQQDLFASHTHQYQEATATGGGVGISGTGNFAGGATSATGGIETRPANLSVTYCIWY